MVTTAMSPMEYNFHMGDMYLKGERMLQTSARRDDMDLSHN